MRSRIGGIQMSEITMRYPPLSIDLDFTALTIVPVRPVSLDVTPNFFCPEFEGVVISLSFSSDPSQGRTHRPLIHLSMVFFWGIYTNLGKMQIFIKS